MLTERLEASIRNLLRNQPTPFYLYDLSAVSERLATIKNRIGSDVEVLYSAKANSHPQILSSISQKNFSIDVTSAAELERAVAAGFPVTNISFTGPGKRDHEIRKAIELGIGSIVVETLDELEAVESEAGKKETRATIAVRLTPSQRIGHSGRLIVGEPTQFGVEEEAFDEFLRRLSEMKHVELVGTHSHLQSQVLDYEYLLKNFEFALETSILFQSKLRQIEGAGSLRSQFRVALGGGVGIPYSARSNAFDFDLFAVALRRLVQQYTHLSPLVKRLRFSIELGRYLVGEAGYFVSRIIRTKKSGRTDKQVQIGIADGGYSHCQIATGVGQTIRSNLPFTVLKESGGQRATGSAVVSIAGSTCYSQDILVREASLDGISVGDYLVVKNVGAYGKQFSPKDFLLQPEAAEHFLEVK